MALSKLPASGNCGNPPWLRYEDLLLRGEEVGVQQELRDERRLPWNHKKYS
jgi:hypothetical protein